MKGSRANRSSPSTGSPAGPAPKADKPPPKNGGNPDTLIKVQCPNPSCRKVYTIRDSFAGKNGQCTCGAVFSIPKVGQRSGDVPSPAPGNPPQGHRGRAADEDSEVLHE